MTSEHLYCRARAVFGTDHQIDKAREEAAELVLAICHRDRDGDDALVEECADVEITNAQLRLILGADRVDAMVAAKLARLEERVAKAEDAASAGGHEWRNAFPETPTKPSKVVR